MAKTPGNLPYPVGTDKVFNGDNAIQQLATAMRIWGGTVVFGTSAGAKSVDRAIVFPVGLFTAPPVVVAFGMTVSSGDPIPALIVGLANNVAVTAAGATLRMSNTANNAWTSSYTCNWLAFQPPAA